MDAELVFVNKLERRFECPVCGSILQFPVQFQACGHRCCSSCLSEIMRVDAKCPVDQMPIDKDKVYLDKAFQQELDKIKVKCPHTDRGCVWAGVVADLKDHTERCSFLVVTCPLNCGQQLEKRNLNNHTSSECQKRELRCQFCQAKYLYEDEQDHLNKCDFVPVQCVNGCKMEVRRNKMDEHVKKECGKQEVDCPLAHVGCKVKVARKKMDKHMQDTVTDHVTLLSKAAEKMQETIDGNQQLIEQQNERITAMGRHVDTLEKLHGSQLVWKVTDYAEKLQEAKDGTRTTLYSPAFTTSRHGYKIVVSLCLYGDGKATGKHMSVFLCLCRGQYDALLKWPFDYTVTFTLLDQHPNPVKRHNATHTITPNPVKGNLTFLGRPTGEKNASFGVQKFLDLSVLESRHFVKDDTIFLKVDVESEAMLQL